MPRYGTLDAEYGARLASFPPDADGPIYMLNLMKYRAVADYDDGADAGPAVSGREADDRYSPTDVFERIGAELVFVADVVRASEDWDRVAVVRYPTRRSFVDMAARRDFQAKHVHKEAGMDRTIVVGTVPDAAMPSRAKPSRVVLDLWCGAAPTDVGTTFTVEGTVFGDGRPWSGAAFRVADGDDAAITAASSPVHQVLLLQPRVDRWR
jgi:hypothetical protein